MLRDSTRPILHRRLTLTFGWPECPRPMTRAVSSYSSRSKKSHKALSASDTISSLLADPSFSFILLSIRELILSASPWCMAVDMGIWLSLSMLISRLSSVLQVRFHCNMQLPLVILDALHQHHPGAHLHVYNWVRSHDGLTLGDSSEEALARSPCLRSISVNRRQGEAFTWPAFARIIGLAPNLTSVYCFYLFVNEEGMLHLDEADLAAQEEETKRFLEINTPPNPIKDLHWAASIHYLAPIHQALDLSAIESLHGNLSCADPLLLPNMGQTFPSLKRLHISTSLRQDPGLLAAVISSCKPLESLAIVRHRPLTVLQSVLACHGSSLTWLALHHMDFSFDEERPVLSPTELERMRDEIPRLQYLEIDINHTPSGQRELEIYKALASFPKLSSVTLRYDVGVQALGRMGSGNGVYEGYSEGFGKEVWSQIRSSNPGCLQMLTLCTGEPSPQRGGLLRIVEDGGDGRVVAVNDEIDDMRILLCAVQCTRYVP